MDFSYLHYDHARWLDFPGHRLPRDFPREEYELRVSRARSLMARTGLDALVITTQAVGHWFTSRLEPHEWHDRCQSRSAWYVLTHERDVLFMTPTSGGEHFSTTRRSIWVSDIRRIVERAPWPRREIWNVEQMAQELSELGLGRGRLGFELGDCMTLGLSFNDFSRLRELMPSASLDDGSAVIRNLMSTLTPFEIDLLERACSAGV